MSRKKKRHISKGTGRRYTSSQSKPQSAPVRRTPPPPSHAEKALRKRIIQFGLGERFKEDFKKAFEMYVGPEAVQKHGDRTILLLDEEKDEDVGISRRSGLEIRGKTTHASGYYPQRVGFMKRRDASG